MAGTNKRDKTRIGDIKIDTGSNDSVAGRNGVAENAMGVAENAIGGNANAPVIDWGTPTDIAGAPGGYTASDTVASGPAASDTGTVSTGDTAKRKRGRPAGSTNAKKTEPSSVTGIETLLLGIHESLARMVGPELGLEREEAHALATSYDAVALHYPSLQMPAHVTAITTLCAQVALIYGPRFAALRLRHAMEKGMSRSANVPQPQQRQNPPPQQPMPQGEQKINGVDLSAPGPRTLPDELRRVDIPGVGKVELPPDHRF